MKLEEQRILKKNISKAQEMNWKVSDGLVK